MYGLTKKEKLKFILEKVQDLGLSAYEISKGTTLTEAGIARILKKIAKSPHENSLNQIIEFLEKKISGSNTVNTDNTQELTKRTKNDNEKNDSDLIKYAECLEKENKLIKEIVRLQGLLRDNNIEFENFFENEGK